MYSNASGASGIARVAVVVPCHNECSTIGELVVRLRDHLPNAEVLVVDNGSTDATADVAEAAGAHVLSVPRLGKGNAVRAAFACLNADVLLMVDGDLTYDPADAVSVLEPAVCGEADMVIGERLTLAAPSAFVPGRHLANVVMTYVVNRVLGARCKDVLSGYRAMTRQFLSKADLSAEGFEIEVELLCEARRLGARVVDIPVGYDARHKGSASKLSPVRDAVRIMATAVRRRPRRTE